MQAAIAVSGKTCWIDSRGRRIDSLDFRKDCASGKAEFRDDGE